MEAPGVEHAEECGVSNPFGDLGEQWGQNRGSESPKNVRVSANVSEEVTRVTDALRTVASELRGSGVLSKAERQRLASELERLVAVASQD